MYGNKSSGPRVPKSCPQGFLGRYTVQKGDSMFSIAKRFGVSLDALIAANPHITNPSVIFPGDVLCVPLKGTHPPPHPPPPPPPPPQRDGCCPCPITLGDFLGRSVEVLTTCGAVNGELVFVGDHSIILQDRKTTTTIMCQEICFVRILRGRGNTNGS